MWRKRRYIGGDILIGVLAAAGVSVVACTIYKLMKGRDKNNQCHIESEKVKIINSAEDVLLNKIGVTSSELEEAKKTNKSAFELAKEKGFSEEQLKMFINEKRYVAIDELVLNRKISREIGEQVKEKIKEHTDKWSGDLC